MDIARTFKRLNSVQLKPINYEKSNNISIKYYVFNTVSYE